MSNPCESCHACVRGATEVWHARRTSHEEQGAAEQVSLGSVHDAGRSGLPRGRRRGQVLYSHAGVSVHAAMCLALALGRRCGLPLSELRAL